MLACGPAVGGWSVKARGAIVYKTREIIGGVPGFCHSYYSLATGSEEVKILKGITVSQADPKSSIPCLVSFDGGAHERDEPLTVGHAWRW